jgi:hypothetical protein
MQFASASSERGKARPVCLGTTDSAERSPAESEAAATEIQNDFAGTAPVSEHEPSLLERNAVGIAALWSVFYVIALVIAGGYGGVELLRRSLEIAVLPGG